MDSERSEPEREGEILGEGALRQMEKTEDQWTENDASSIMSDSPEPEKVLDDGESDSYTTGDEGVVQDAGEREDTANLQMVTTENIVNLQRLVTSLATQVTNLSSKVEDYDFKNGLLLRTVEIQQVGMRGFIDNCTFQQFTDQDLPNVRDDRGAAGEELGPGEELGEGYRGRRCGA